MQCHNETTHLELLRKRQRTYKQSTSSSNSSGNSDPRLISSNLKDSKGRSSSSQDSTRLVRGSSSSLRHGVYGQNEEATEMLKELRDCKVLMRTLILGLKTVVWSASNLRSVAQNYAQGHDPKSAKAPAMNTRKGLSDHEGFLVAKLLKSALKCFAIYTCGPSPSTTEEKEMLDLFAQVFTVLEVRNFQDIIGARMSIIFDHMVENQAMLTIPQHFLANANISKQFAEILLVFLVERMELLGKCTDKKDNIVASVLLRLFKIVFASVTLFPDNEPVLQPHLASIVTSSLHFATSNRDAHNYLQLLRALFKSIATGKFELLYKEFTPLLQPLLCRFLQLEKSPYKQSMADTIVELCLSVPARPSSILPYIYSYFHVTSKNLNCVT